MTNVDRDALLNALHDRIDGDYLIDGDGEPVALTSSGAADVVRWAADAVAELVEDARAEGRREAGRAFVQWAMKNEIDEPPLDWAWFGEIVRWTGAGQHEATP